MMNPKKYALHNQHQSDDILRVLEEPPSSTGIKRESSLCVSVCICELVGPLLAVAPSLKLLLCGVQSALEVALNENARW